MATNNDTKTVVINFKILPSDAVKTIQDTKVKIENLKKTLEGMRKAGLENSEMYIKLQAALRDMNQTVRANQKVLVDSIKQQKANGDSINAMRASLKELRAEYENLSKAERNSASGQELIAHIQSLTTELNKLEQEQLDFTRSVGNYKSALEGLPFGKVISGFMQLSQGTGKLSVAFGNAMNSVKIFGKEMLALLANPFVAGFTAIVAIVMKLTDSIKKNDEAMTALKSLFASLQPILNLIEKGFQAIADVVAKVANGISSFIQKVTQLIPSLRDYSKANEDLVRSKDALEDTEREYTKNHAIREEQISELRNKAVQADKYSAKERKKFLQEAMDLEKEDLEEKKDIATERYRIAEEEALLEIGVTEMTEEAWKRLSDERKNQLTELEAAMHLANKEFNDGTRRMQSQVSRLGNASANTRKERLKNEREALKELENMLANSIKDVYDKETAAITNNYEQQIAALKEKLTTEKNLTTAARQYINQQIVLLESDLQLKLGEIREKRQNETWKRELENRKNFYSKMLGNLSTEDARVEVRLKINEADTKLALAQLDEVLEGFKKTTQAAADDLTKATSGDMPLQVLEMKYKAVWEALEIDEGDALKNMQALLKHYQDEEEKAMVEHSNMVIQIKQSQANEELRIRQSANDKEWSLQQKHNELMQELEKAKSFATVSDYELDLFRKKELEKTKILQEEAERRLEVAKNEQQRIADQRAQYTDQELAALYGSIEEFNNKFLEAELKVAEAENAVAQSIQKVADVSKGTKIAMVDFTGKVLGSIGQMTSAFSSLFNTMAEGDEDMQKYANALALTDIMVSMAQGIAAAVAEGMKMGWPAAAIMIPVGIATVVSGIASAIALFKKNDNVKSAPKFAGGGLVGNKTTRRKDDTVDAKLTLGEYVIPAPVVDDLGVDFFDKLTKSKAKDIRSGSLRFAEGGIVKPKLPEVSAMTDTFDWDMMREVMADAVSEIQPVVSVKEITNKQNRVRVKESIAKQ